MSVREKLVEIIQNSVGGCARHWAEIIADGLIAHGVTIKDVPDINVGEWISVDDRLPTYEDGKVLIYTAYGISIAQKTTTNHWKGDNAIPKLITHWKPLPEPPKGE